MAKERILDAVAASADDTTVATTVDTTSAAALLVFLCGRGAGDTSGVTVGGSSAGSPIASFMTASEKPVYAYLVESPTESATLAISGGWSAYGAQRLRIIGCALDAVPSLRDTAEEFSSASDTLTATCDSATDDLVLGVLHTGESGSVAPGTGVTAEVTTSQVGVGVLLSKEGAAPTQTITPTFSFGSENGLAVASFSFGSPAPVLSSPSSSSITQTTATVGYSTDNATGTSYIVVTTSATEPSAAQIKAGTDHADAAAAFDTTDAALELGANSFAVTGLTADTAYYAYVIQNDGSADSNIVSESFSTLSVAPTITPGSGEVFDQTVNSLRARATTDTDNGTMYFGIYATSVAANAATDAEIKAESTTLTDAVAAAAVAVSATGVVSTSAITGLSENTTYYVAAVHEGDVTQNGV